MKYASRTIARTRSAFTLLELLVVIVLIVVAAAFVLPTIFKNNEVKYRIQCAANLKQIGLAIQLYSNENKGSYPRTNYVKGAAPTFSNDTSDGGTKRDPFGNDGLPGKVADNDITAAMFLLVRTQDITAEVFVCPDTDQERDVYGRSPGASAQNKTSFTDWRKNLSYSFANVYPDEEAIKLGYKMNATTGAEIAILADMNPGVGDNYDVTLPMERSPSADLKKANSRNHKGAGQNVLYGDGHVEFQQTAFCGQKRDNIYTVSGSDDGSKTTSKTVIGIPKWSGDSVLMPAYK